MEQNRKGVGVQFFDMVDGFGLRSPKVRSGTGNCRILVSCVKAPAKFGGQFGYLVGFSFRPKYANKMVALCKGC